MSGSATVGERPQPQTAGGLWLALASAALFGAGLAWPELRPLAVAAPFPVSLLRLKTGPGLAALVVFLAFAVVGASFGPGYALAFLFFFAAPGLLIGEALVRGRGLVRGCGWAFGLWILLAGAGVLGDHQALARSALALFEYDKSPRFLADLKEMGFSADAAEAMVEQLALFRRVVAV